ARRPGPVPPPRTPAAPAPGSGRVSAPRARAGPRQVPCRTVRRRPSPPSRGTAGRSGSAAAMPARPSPPSDLRVETALDQVAAELHVRERRQFGDPPARRGVALDAAVAEASGQAAARDDG